MGVVSNRPPIEPPKGWRASPRDKMVRGRDETRKGKDMIEPARHGTEPIEYVKALTWWNFWFG